MNIEKELELFLSSKLISETIKFETLEYYYDDNLIVFKDRVLNFMWHAWLASRNREGYVLVPVEPTEEMYLSGYDCKVENGSTIDIYKAMIGACDD
jgi:hypothetical protein